MAMCENYYILFKFCVSLFLVNFLYPSANKLIIPSSSSVRFKARAYDILIFHAFKCALQTFLRKNVNYIYPITPLT